MAEEEIIRTEANFYCPDSLPNEIPRNFRNIPILPAPLKQLSSYTWTQWSAQPRKWFRPLKSWGNHDTWSNVRLHSSQEMKRILLISTQVLQGHCFFVRKGISEKENTQRNVLRRKQERRQATPGRCKRAVKKLWIPNWEISHAEPFVQGSFSQSCIRLYSRCSGMGILYK